MEGKRLSYFIFGVFLVLLSVFRNIHGESVWNLEENRDGWIDPHSMVENELRLVADAEKSVCGICEKQESDCTPLKEELTKCSVKVEHLQENLDKQIELYRKSETVAVKEKPFFEQFIRRILDVFKKFKDSVNKGHYEADVTISSHNYEDLSNYVTKQNVSVQEIHSILLKMLTTTRWIREDDDLDDDDFKDGFHVSVDSRILFWLNVGTLIVVMTTASLQLVKMLRNVQISLSRLVFLVFFVLLLTSFIVSVPWTWWHLYKKEVAKRMAAAAHGPPDCHKQLNGFWRTVSSVFFIQNDECQKYFEQLEIDPFWEVPPTQAIAVTFIRFLLEPAGHVGRAIREFMVSAFEGLPFYLWLPVYAFILVLVILMLFCLGGYRVAMPFLSIEPARSSDDRVARLRSQIQELEDENRNLQKQLASTERQIKEGNGRGDEKGLRLQLEAGSNKSDIQEASKDTTTGQAFGDEQNSVSVKTERCCEPLRTASTGDLAVGAARSDALENKVISEAPVSATEAELTETPGNFSKIPSESNLRLQEKNEEPEFTPEREP